MSAIAGLWHFQHGPDRASDCERMLAAQAIYGPHDGRAWSDESIAIGRRLFRTLPEDAYDEQPLRSRDGRWALVCDVRLDNRDELIGLLGRAAAEGARLSDAAVLFECLQAWGERTLDRIVGDFAFALWDKKSQKLSLARDFRGGRPLHYHRGQEFFAFASMPKGLHALNTIAYAPDEDAVAEFLALMPQTSSRSFFKDVERVRPAEIVTVTRDKISARKYWDPSAISLSGASLQDHVDGVRHHLDRATKASLRGAGGAVGAHLSGGLDSGAVCATAARLLAPAGGKVVAFTNVPYQGYDGSALRNQRGDEGPLAAATAAKYSNIEHVLVRAGHLSPLDALDRIFYLYEQPQIALPVMRLHDELNRLARERKINVMLTGAMGDMALSYNGLELLNELLGQAKFPRLWHESSALLQNTALRWRGLLLQIFGPFIPVALWQWLHRFFLDRNRDLSGYTALRPEAIAAFNLRALARERKLDFSYRPWTSGRAMRLWVLHRNDVGSLIKGTLAGWGIDRRDPLADKRLFEYCFAIPTEQFLHEGIPRALARRALADRLPAAVVNEQRKGLAAADWYAGLNAARRQVGEEIERIAECAPAARMLDLSRLRKNAAHWPNSDWDSPPVVQTYRLALLRGISAGHFLRKSTGLNR